ERLCALCEIPPASLMGVATFFSEFRLRPVGRHMARVCVGTACHIKGAPLVADALRQELGLEGEQETDAEGRFTVEKVACMGCCTLAPVVQIDSVTYGRMTPERVPVVLLDSETRKRSHGVAESLSPAVVEGNRAEIRIGLGSCCVAGGSSSVYAAFLQAVERTGIPATIKPVGCVGMCYATPLVEITRPGEPPCLYGNVHAEDVPAILHRHFQSPKLLGRVRATLSRTLDMLLTDEAWAPPADRALDVRTEPVSSFLLPQRHLATEHRGALAPLDLAEYRRVGGFQALIRAFLEQTPEEIVSTITRSGHRGRGGAGFPTGRKWATVREASGDRKYVVCNGDEGDPGAFMDRMILESYPYRVLEGMAIAARAVGADQGFLYVRAEYPLALERIDEALRRAEAEGLMGDDVQGTGLSLHLRIVRGAGAFVCGEETAMIASIEGRRGTPRLRPPFPATAGLWERPTLVNNVETYALVPWIMQRGAEAFSAIGTARSKGTKVFALAGKVARGGLVEVPMGTTIREIVEDVGGGIEGGRSFKAVQIGGPSGGCIPARLADTKVDYEALVQLGAMMGSGGLVVLDDSDCMVDVARYFLEFTQGQSCGKCTFCRVGTKRMLEILNRLCAGEGHAGDLEELERLAALVGQGSLCGLGRTAPNPVITTLRYFRDEYEAHLEGRCPAGRCRGIIRYRITNSCIGCTKCAQSCAVRAIAARPYEKHEIDLDVCTRCGVCVGGCPEAAILVE
ncbi:NAD(P)H-dependent oxidoreductase subunit E, partial [Planctomycetota bacterium]